MQSLAEPYNHWMKQCFLVFLDEVQTKALINEAGVIAKVKNWITEKMVPVRAMYEGSREVRNYNNWILASNMSDVVTIEKGDRRFNVAKYQPLKLVITDKELELIERELQSFHDYLLYYKADRLLAGQVLDTADRATMISISESSVDTVGSAIQDGSFKFLVEQLPSAMTGINPNALENGKTEDYKEVLKALLLRTDRNNGICNIARDELKIIFNYVVGGMPTSPNKFTSLLKHHRIHMKDVWINTGTTAGKERGMTTHFLDLAAWQGYQDILTPPAAKTKTVIAKGKAKVAIV
jgi:hypothetical protein